MRKAASEGGYWSAGDVRVFSAAMRLFYALAAVLVVAGCQTAADPAKLAAAHDQQCQGFGFKPGTDGYAACRLQLYQSAQAHDDARRARIAAAFSEAGENMQRSANRQAQISQTLIQNNRTINCTTTRYSATMSGTSCQ